MSAGVGVTMVIGSPARGAVTYAVAPAEMDRFGNALQAVQNSLANQASE